MNRPGYPTEEEIQRLVEDAERGYPIHRLRPLTPGEWEHLYALLEEDE